MLALPTLPAWSILGFLAMVPAFYKFQSWNHKIWTAAADMSEFNRRFPPGRDLNLILLVYEIPICLNYLLFRREDWSPEARSLIALSLAAEGDHDVVPVLDREGEAVEHPSLQGPRLVEPHRFEERSEPAASIAELHELVEVPEGEGRLEGLAAAEVEAVGVQRLGDFLEVRGVEHRVVHRAVPGAGEPAEELRVALGLERRVGGPGPADQATSSRPARPAGRSAAPGGPSVRTR